MGRLRRRQEQGEVSQVQVQSLRRMQGQNLRFVGQLCSGRPTKNTREALGVLGRLSFSMQTSQCDVGMRSAGVSAGATTRVFRTHPDP